MFTAFQIYEPVLFDNTVYTSLWDVTLLGFAVIVLVRRNKMESAIFDQVKCFVVRKNPFRKHINHVDRNVIKSFQHLETFLDLLLVSCSL